MSTIYHNELGWRVKNECVFVYHLESTLPPFNLLFYLSISEGDCMPYLMINRTTGEVYTSAILDRDDHFNLRHNGWCNVTIKVCSMFYISLSLPQNLEVSSALQRIYFFLIWMVSESYSEFISLLINKPSMLQYNITLILLKRESKWFVYFYA